VFKRAAEANADADYGYAHPPCEKVMKEICKRVSELLYKY